MRQEVPTRNTPRITLKTCAASVVLHGFCHGFHMPSLQNHLRNMSIILRGRPFEAIFGQRPEANSAIPALGLRTAHPSPGSGP